MHLRTALFFAVLTATVCATPPRPTEMSLRLARNERAVIEGRVVDRRGDPVAGIDVEGLPRGRDVPWSPGSATGREGRFRLTVFAPAEYGFVLSFNGRTVITPGPDDPARLRIMVHPGERREGIKLVFLREEWQKTR